MLLFPVEDVELLSVSLFEAISLSITELSIFALLLLELLSLSAVELLLLEDEESLEGSGLINLQSFDCRSE